jgi:hypothetical protein
MRSALLLLLAAAPSVFLHAQTNSHDCKGNPGLAAACYVVHGRMQFTNGTPDLRIWVVGTKHYLGVVARIPADDTENPKLPSNVEKKIRGFKTIVYGDFEVCPFSRETPGAMTMVCVESATKLVTDSADSD